MKEKEITIRVVGEFTGSTILILLGCMGCANTDSSNILWSSLQFGLVVTVIAHCFGSISGGHANPNVTFACALLGITTKNTAIFYIVAQILGAIFGFLLLIHILPHKKIYGEDALCLPIPSDGITTLNIFGIEFVLTFIVILGWLAYWDPRNNRFIASAPLVLGSLTSACCIAGSSFTGASMNTARSLAPAIFHGNFNNLFTYIFAQNCASIAAAFFWSKTFKYIKPQTTTSQYEPTKIKIR